MNKLSEAVTRFLGKTLEWFGMIPEDPLIDRSIAAKVPLALLDHTAQASVGFSAAARNLQPEKGMASIRPGVAYSFFDGLRRTADLVEEI